jgi:ribosome-binding protein aMBF1 (putative translation factor)
MDNKPYFTWEEMEERLQMTEEQKEEIRLETEIIQSIIDARKKKKLSQRDLSKISGVKQPVIARMETYVTSPDTSTIIKVLAPLGLTLKVVPKKSKAYSQKQH